MTALRSFHHALGGRRASPRRLRFPQVAPEVSPRERADVLLIDQHHRYQTGNPLAVEAYFRGFPEVAADPELKLDLVFGELRHAAQSGERPPTSTRSSPDSRTSRRS